MTGSIITCKCCNFNAQNYTRSVKGKCGCVHVFLFLMPLETNLLYIYDHQTLYLYLSQTKFLRQNIVFQILLLHSIDNEVKYFHPKFVPGSSIGYPVKFHDTFNFI